MQKTNEHRIYENNIILKHTLSKVISSFKNITDRIIFINILYSDDRGCDTAYSGMKYIVNLRGEKKDTTPVIFYGFQKLEHLKKKPDASILNSPAVEYIKMPFLLEELYKKILNITAYSEIKDGLDKKTKQIVALENMKVFKHDIQNAVNTIKIAYKLKRNGSLDVQKENWNSVKKSLSAPKAKDQINKNIIQFENIKDNIVELLSGDAIINVNNKLLDAEGKYKILIKRLDEDSERNKNIVISDTEIIINLLKEVIKMLEAVKV